MNTTAGMATLFTDDTVETDGPIVRGPTLVEWATDPIAGSWLTDDALRAEAAEVTPARSPSRRLYGAYLAWAFDHIRARLTERGAAVEIHADEAVAVDDESDGRHRVSLAGGAQIVVDVVVLALGHVGSARAEPSRSPVSGRPILRAANASDQPLDALEAGTTVLVSGLGLGFYDLTAVLSRGRGGRFDRDADGVLVYTPSGHEPTIVAGSRRGFPFRAKSRGAVPAPAPRRSPTPGRLADLHSRRGSLDFDRDLWPLIVKEAAWQFLAASNGDDLDLSDVGAHLDGLHRIDEIRDLLRQTGGAAPYDPARRGDPLRDLTFADADALNDHLERLLSDDVAEADLATSAAKAADRAIGASRTWLQPLVAFGGLTGVSQRTHYERWFEGYANSIAGGPPTHRVEEVLALSRAGLLRFAGAGMVVADTDAGLVATSTSVPSVRFFGDALVEARMPEFDVAASSQPLVSQLYRSGAVRPFTIGTGSQLHRTAGLEVAPGDQSVIRADGSPTAGRFALGIPVGTYLSTSVSALAGTNSLFLRQTDAVARAALHLLGAAAAPRASAAVVTA
jgi:hypothetical protein